MTVAFEFCDEALCIAQTGKFANPKFVAVIALSPHLNDASRVEFGFAFRIVTQFTFDLCLQSFFGNKLDSRCIKFQVACDVSDLRYMVQRQMKCAEKD